MNIITRQLKALLLTAVLAFVSVSWLGCGGDSNPAGGGGGGGGGGSGSSGTLTVTGIPSKFNGMYAYTMMSTQEPGSGIGLVFGGQSLNSSDGVVYKFSRISNGKANMSLWVINGIIVDKNTGNSGFDVKRYSGNEVITTVTVVIVGVENANDLDDEYVRAGVVFQQIKFSNGGATRSWSDGIFVEYE
jgi:hypothetical protein